MPWSRGSCQAFDESYLTAALEVLGPQFVGVTQLPPEVEDARLRRLHDAGVRALRFNLRRGSSAGLEALALRVHTLLAWHVELYVDSRDLADLELRLRALPQIVVDHPGLSEAGLPSLLRLAEGGAKVKASGFGRLDFLPGPLLRQIAEANPQALLFCSDLLAICFRRARRVPSLLATSICCALP